jgi:hypothetical protein
MPNLLLPSVEAHHREIFIPADVLDAFFATIGFPQYPILSSVVYRLPFIRLVLSCVPD